MFVVRSVALLMVFLLANGAALAQKKKKKNKRDEEPVTQVLEVLPDPPPAIKVESSRLVFFVSPLTAKGLLSQQAKEALVALRKQAHGATFVKLRAFVASRGDARRVAAIVSEQFAEWKQPLPVLSLLQVGALPLLGAQVWIEAIAEDRKPINLNGIEWLAARQVTKPLNESGDPNAVFPLLEESLGGLTGEVVSLTCLVSSLDNAGAIEKAMALKFPNAARTLMQAQRATGSGLARCEAATRRLTGEAERLVLTGTLIGFGTEAKDAKLLEDRLSRLLEANNARLLLKRAYGISRGLEASFGPLSVIEGVGSNEATVAIEAIAILKY